VQTEDGTILAYYSLYKCVEPPHTKL